MKRAFLYLWIVCLPAVISFAQTNESAPKLTGIVNLPDMKCALLEVQPPRRFSSWEKLTLREGERESGVEVLEIDESKGSVEINTDGRQVSLSFEGSAEDRRDWAVRIKDADLQQVLDLYGEIANRNVLQSPAFKGVRISLNAKAMTGDEAAREMEKAFQQQGMAVIHDGKTFVIVVPALSTNTVKTGSEKASSGGESHVEKPQAAAETFPKGTIQFMDAEVDQAARLYGELVGRKLNKADSLLWGPPIHFRTVTPLSKAEASYALETLFRLGGLEVVLIGDKEFKLVFRPDYIKSRIRDPVKLW